MSHEPVGDRALLSDIARRAMVERGLEPEFPPAALAELARIRGAAEPAPGVRDLRGRLWCSIDNDDSRDLDQLTVAEELPGGRVRILVAIADVDALVKKDSAIDKHAALNTTSVYTPAVIFPMLPENLSTNLTSLNEGEDRDAVVADMVFDESGALAEADIYLALVHNRAKLAYNSVAAWLEGEGPEPSRVQEVAGLEENLRLQDRVAQRLAGLRHDKGALSLETVQARAVFERDTIKGLEADRKNRARQLIEDFMIAANGVSATYLEAKKFPSFRRVLRSPDRWERIMQLAAQHGVQLPAEPDGAALEKFLEVRRKADPEKYPDLSLAIVKLMGRGEYAVDLPGGQTPGHFGLAVRDYSHSTAPNRRFPDLITQRLLKAAMRGEAMPYTVAQLTALAQHCTDQEDAATKVERQLRKSAAALLLSGSIGHEFPAIVTGASEKATWVRLFDPPVEGRLQASLQKLDVGDRLVVKLLSTDVQRGFIDFARA